MGALIQSLALLRVCNEKAYRELPSQPNSEMSMMTPSAAAPAKAPAKKRAGKKAAGKK